MEKFKGLGTSSGISIGKVFIYKEVELRIKKTQIVDSSVEIYRLESALHKAIEEIEKIYEITLATIGQEEAELFIAHRMMLEDPIIISEIKDKIIGENVNSEWAVNQVVNFYIDKFENIQDEYLKGRGTDLKDVSKRLLRVLLNLESLDLNSINEKSIIIAEDITPSNTAQMNIEMVVGIVTELGGKTSHTSIMARTLEVPAIVGVKDATNLLSNGDTIIIDGDSGEIIINPSARVLRDYEAKKKELEILKLNLMSMKTKETISKDGHKVLLTGNIGSPKDIEKVLKNHGEGVGLYRTEFLYMDKNRLPTEEEQFKSYRIVAEKLGKLPLVIRTLDVGGDKDLPYLDLPNESNPLLGYRAIRISLDRLDIFKTQLRAILRASVFGNIKIMFPMISNIKEIKDAKAIIEEIKAELTREDTAFNKDIEIGIMVEIPAVAVHSAAFAKEVDFFSIGTNDLIQYTLAVDRGNMDIAYLYNQFHPAVLRLIQMTIENAHKEGIKVGMCGDIAGDQKLIPVLLGMGLDEFSMSASSILESRSLIKDISKDRISEMLEELLNLSTAEDVEDYIDKNILN